MAKQNLKGKRINLLTVVEEAYSKNGNVFWKCQCECGKICFYSTSDLNRGQVKSCGCYKKSHNSNYKHGLTHKRIRNIWVNMIQRCENPNNPNFNDYGGRGVSVCSEWHDLNQFNEWANNSGYDENLTLDRINVNGNYEPSNCRWVTRKAQSNNKRVNLLVEIDGVSHTIAEWSDISGISRTTLYRRYHKGLSGQKFLNTEYEDANG